MAKRTRKDLVSTSKLAQELIDDKPELIKQPYLFAMIGGDFSLVQRGIMVEVVGCMQDRFIALLNARKDPKTKQLSLFTEDEINKEVITFKIDIASLGVRPDAYDELEAACNNLLSMKLSFKDIDQSTGRESRVYSTLFSQLLIPADENPHYKFKEKKRRKNYIEAKMMVNTLNYLCNLDNGMGYIDHIRKITRICKKKRTPGLYIYLARAAKDFTEKYVEYVELKKFLGVIVPDMIKDETTGKMINGEKDLYPKFSRFRSDVLDPIKDELDRLAAENKVEFSFDYEPKYKHGKRRGDPERIHFVIRLSGLGEQLYKKRKKIKSPSDIWDMLRAEYALTDSDVRGLSDMLPEELVPLFRKEVLELKERMLKYSVKNTRGYAVTSLKNFITQHTPSVEEIKDEQIDAIGKEEKKSQTAPRITEEEQKKWEEFMNVISLNVNGMDFNTWFSAIGFVSFANNILTLSVPTSFVKDYIEENFMPAMGSAVKAVFGELKELNYQVIQP